MELNLGQRQKTSAYNEQYQAMPTAMLTMLRTGVRGGKGVFVWLATLRHSVRAIT